MTRPILGVLEGERQPIPPVWMMRQAGRYLPEYRKAREQAGSFLNLCFSPKLAAEVTLQPIRRFGFDAAILFSDILVVPHGLGVPLAYESGEGPKLEAVDRPDKVARLRRTLDHSDLERVYETIAIVKAALPQGIALLGFCGAPWTVATYMIAGHGTVDQAPARVFSYQNPDAMQTLVDVLVEASAEYLIRQLEAGADAVQIFDTWAGVLTPAQFQRWCIEPTAALVAAVRSRRPDAKIIGFPRGAGTGLPRYLEGTGVDAVGLDWMVDRDFARRELQTRRPVQGNLDPLALLAGGAELDREIDAVLGAFADGPFIFNLGHGIVPETPIGHVEQMLERVRRER